MSELINEADLRPPEADAGPRSAKLSLGGVSWSIFEGGRDPYVILITIYIFMPYFASVVVGDPVKGQEAVASYGQYSGWIVMATAPFLGAAIDRLGRRKGWLGLAVGLMVPLIWAPRHAGEFYSLLLVFAQGFNGSEPSAEKAAL